RLVRFGLVPERDAGEFVTAAVVVAVLDGDADVALEHDRVLDVEAVQGDGVAPVRAATGDDAVVRRGVLLRRAPRGVEVVLGAGAVEGGWPRVVGAGARLGPRLDDGSLRGGVRLHGAVAVTVALLALRRHQAL